MLSACVNHVCTIQTYWAINVLPLLPSNLKIKASSLCSTTFPQRIFISWKRNSLEKDQGTEWCHLIEMRWGLDRCASTWDRTAGTTEQQLHVRECFAEWRWCVGKFRPQQGIDKKKGCRLTHNGPAFIPTQWWTSLSGLLQFVLVWLVLLWQRPGTKQIFKEWVSHQHSCICKGFSQFQSAASMERLKLSESKRHQSNQVCRPVLKALMCPPLTQGCQTSGLKTWTREHLPTFLCRVCVAGRRGVNGNTDYRLRGKNDFYQSADPLTKHITRMKL